MTFRTPKEAVSCQQHAVRSRPSVWTENINLALDVAPKLKPRRWVNCTNIRRGVGSGYRESDWERAQEDVRIFEGDYETRNADGMRRHHWGREANSLFPHSAIRNPQSDLPPIDRTYKLFIAANKPPRSGYSRKIVAPTGRMCEVGKERKDIRNAVEARTRPRLAMRPAYPVRNPLLYRREPGDSGRRVREPDRALRADVDAEAGGRGAIAGSYHRLGRQMDGAVAPHADPCDLAMQEPVVCSDSSAQESSRARFLSLWRPRSGRNTVIAHPLRAHPIARPSSTVLEPPTSGRC